MHCFSIDQTSSGLECERQLNILRLCNLRVNILKIMRLKEFVLAPYLEINIKIVYTYPNVLIVYTYPNVSIVNSRYGSE